MKICLSCEGVTDTPAQRCGHCGSFLLPTDAVHYPVRRGEVDAGNPLLGTIIDGKYRLLSVLGRGGLGTVFRAQHIGSLVSVALKLLHPRFAQHRDYRRALLPEARRAATVADERCARLLDVGEGDEGISYLAMELVEGQTLDELLRYGAFAPSHALDVLAQVAEALVAIHAAGLVHCDLSPRNVMVASRGGRLEVKVLDFGIARQMTMIGDGGGRNEWTGFANPGFSAPELLAGGHVDERADLYSFGTLAWLLLTGGMPVDDTDARRAAAAVRDGRLAPWPRTPGVPRRVVALIRQCLRQDPDARPASADDVLRRLQAVRAGKGPVLVRFAVFAAGLAVLAALATNEAKRPVFLRPRTGSLLELTAEPLPPGAPVAERTSRRLRQLEFLYSGFDPARLRAEISRDGLRLIGKDLRPEVNVAAGSLVLSTAQSGWNEVVEGLLQTSRDGPVELSFVAPGPVLLGSARLRVDDTAPTVAARLEGAADGCLRRDTRLAVEVADDVGVAAASARLEFDRGEQFTLQLPVASGEFALGAELAAQVQGVADLGPGRLSVAAVDLAGNRANTTALAFASADVAAPYVAEVTGPAGETFLPRVADRLRLRVRLSAAEPGCELRCFPAGAAAPTVLPLSASASRDALWQPLELSAAVLPPGATELALHLVVVDRAGNEAARDFALPVRDRSLLLELQPERGELRWTGQQLIASTSGGVVRASVGPAFAFTGARLDGARPPGEGAALTFQAIDPRHAQLGFERFAPGAYGVLLQIREADSGAAPVEQRVLLRVLPSIEVRVPTVTSRFLLGVLQEHLLAERDSGALGEGPGWRLDPTLRPYVHGTLWVGADGAGALPIAAGEGPLLPDVVPVPGHNVLAIELRDVLDRRVPVVRDDGSALDEAPNGRHVVADFWWNPAAPETIGQRLLVEYGQPARLRLRLPLPFRDDELAAIRLGIAQAEIPASQLTRTEDGRTIALFEIPEKIWSVPARLGELSREAFAQGLERSFDAYVETPAARHAGIAIQLVTTRSTLAPMTLGEIHGVPAALAGIRLLPVLAPADAFVEPVPAEAPPRAMFRTRLAIPVRNMPDIVLQDRELTWGEARGLAAFAATLTDVAQRSRCVHHDDALGAQRLVTANLLPPAVAGAARAPDGTTLTGIDFYQAWSLCRLLGIAVAGDAMLFRLPLGCELELAGYGGARRPACHATAAQGGSVSVLGFLGSDASVPPWPSAARCIEFGDVVPTAYGPAFVGLDFGVREWVYDLPQVPAAELLLGEWLADHAAHLRKVREMAFDTAAGGVDPLAALRSLGVVRGLAFAEPGGLIDVRGERLAPGMHRVLPDAVPGVLRVEQLRRDGSDLLQAGREPRLAHVGMRVAGNASDLARLWGVR